jgi:site-specific recombinase XerD
MRKRDSYNLYATRHIYASAQIASGVAPKVLQMSMGHESVAFTMQIYVTPWEKHLLSMTDADKVDRWFAEARRLARSK